MNKQTKNTMDALVLEIAREFEACGATVFCERRGKKSIDIYVSLPIIMNVGCLTINNKLEGWDGMGTKATPAILAIARKYGTDKYIKSAGRRVTFYRTGMPAPVIG